MFRNRLGEVANTEAGKTWQVLGISVDGSESHHSFIKNLGLTFPLASDSQGTLCGALGTCPGYQPGNFFNNIVRGAFVVEGDGRISRVFNANGSPALISLIWDTALAE